MNNKVLVFKVSDGDGSVIYLEHDDNVMRVVNGFVDYAEPNQKMIIETVELTVEELQKLPRGW